MRERTLRTCPSASYGRPFHSLFRRLHWLVMLLLTGPAAFAQLAGAYTINDALPTAGRNYASFTAAATALSAGGVSAPVTFSVSGGPYTEQFSLGQFAGASAANRVTINGNGRTIQFASTTSTQRAVVTLNGADYVTIDSLVVDATTGTYGWGIQLVNNADNNVIRRCSVASSPSSTSTFFAGIVSSASTTAATTAGAASNQNLTLEGNTVTGGYYGITAIGVSTAAPTAGIVLRNNRVRDFYLYGIYSLYLSGPQIVGNDVARPTRAAVSTFYGIYAGTGTTGALISKNRIHQGFAAATTSTVAAYCLYITSGTAATVANPHVVANNLIYNIDGSGTVYGIYNPGSSNVHCYYNTISLDDQTNTGTATTYGFYQTTGTGVEFKNNIVQLTRSGTGLKYAIYLSAAAGSPASDYNDLTGSGPGFNTGYYLMAYPTLAGWRTANNSSYDRNSVAVDPQFANAAGGDLRPSAAALDGRATPIAGVTDDITGATRSTTTPDIGAYEFVPATNDVALLSIDSPGTPIATGPATVTVTVLNNGATALTTLQLQYVLNGGTPTVQAFTLAGGLAPGTSRALSFTVPATIVAGANTLTVTASLPNGTTDPTPANNSQSVTIYPALGGAYTINNQQPTSGRNFTSFGDAATALSSAGIAAAVSFSVLNGPYTEQLLLNSITGTSATAGVVFNGNGRTIQFGSSVSAQRAVVQLNGSDYVTIDSLVVDATENGASASPYGWGVQLVNGANNNVIRRCRVITSTSSTSTNYAGIVLSASTTSATTAGANANQNVTLEGNTVTGGYYGITAVGNSTAAPSPGLVLRNNVVRDFYYYGIYALYLNAAQIIGNEIARPTRTTVGTFYGIYLSTGSTGAAIERNRIHDAFGQASSASSAYGIYLTTGTAATVASPHVVINNLLYSLEGSGLVYAIYNGTTNNAHYYHNTINLDNQTSTSTSATYGLYQTTGTGVEFLNNIVQITRAGTGLKYPIYVSAATGRPVSNYNDLTGSGPGFNTGYYLTAYPTLTAWQAANGRAFDQNSLAVDPQFFGSGSGNLSPSAVVLNNAATPLARVTTDFTGAVRSSTPDIGAYEFAPVTDDVAVVSIDAPTSPALPGSNPITVTIRNGGLAVLTAVTLTYVLDNGTPVSQTFTGLSVAPGATAQLTFTTGLVVASGIHTLRVTGSLPNGSADGNATNNTQTISFEQPTPDNDEPCTAVPLTTAPLTGSNSGASTSLQPGIDLPACSPAAAPRDVWFSFTPTGSSTTLAIAGSAAGMVRVFRSPDCAAGPFTQVFCQSSGASNVSVGAVNVPGLTAGQRYYVAISGYGSSDTPGPFTISASAITGTRAALNSLLTVFPNPSATGQLTLRLAGPTGPGTAELLNGLGQVVLRQSLPSAAEAQLSTRGLAAGLYTLHLRVAGQVLTRKVVLQ